MVVVQTFTKCPTTGFRNRSYLPPDWVGFTQDANAGYRLAMYYPTTNGLPTGTTIDGQTMPAAGWPVSIQFRNTTFTTSTDAYSDNDDEPIENANGEELYWYALRNNCAVAAAQVPAYRAATDTFAAVDADGSTALTTGTHNTVHMPGGIGRYYEGGTVAAIEGNLGKKYLSAFNAVGMCIQHVRYHAAFLKINPESVDIGGISGAACTCAWVAFAPNRAGELGTGGQHEMNTVPNSCHLIEMAIVQHTHWGAYAPMGAFLPTLDTGASTAPNTNWTAAGDASLVLASIRERISVWSHLPGFTSDHVPPCTWNVGDANVPDLNISEPFRLAVNTTVGHDAWNGVVMRNRFERKITLWLKAAVITGIAVNSGTGKQLYNALLDDYGAAALASTAGNKYSDSPFVASWMSTMGTPRWDSVMPRGGIRRRGQTEPVGRVITPANSLRGGTAVTCHLGGAALLIGDGYGNDCNFRVEPGEKVWVGQRGHIWGRSATTGALAYFTALELEREGDE